MAKKKRFDFFAWFSGFGASSLGLTRAGGRGLLAVDVDKRATQTHRRNHPEIPVLRASLAVAKTKDIHGIMRRYGAEDPENWYGLHQVTAPCQGFTEAGQQDPDDPKNNLIMFAALLAEACPRSWLLIENVAGMLSEDGWSERPKFEKTLNALFRRINKARGTSLSIQDAKQYYLYGYNCGLAQRRKRVVLPVPPLGTPMPKPMNLRIQDEEQAVLRDVIGPGFRDPAPHRFKPLTPTERKLYAMIRGGENLGKAVARLEKEGKDVPHAIKSLSSETAWGSKLRRPSWDDNNITVCGILRNRSMGRIDLIHPEELRHLSLYEMAALNGIPLDWIIRGNIDEQYGQVGNAFPPAMAELAARAYVLGEYPKQHVEE